MRSRTAHGLTAAAAEGRFALQVCLDCSAVIYPPRDACPSCLSARLPFRDVDRGGTLVAETTVQTSTDPYFRERTPWRVGTVKLDAGPVVVAHLHGDAVEGGRVRLEFKLDKSGSAVAIALPEKDTPNMADDPHLREMTCDPKFRRVLITDGRTAVGQAMAKAFSDAGAVDRVRRPRRCLEAVSRASTRFAEIERVEIVPLDVTDTESVTEQAEQNGARIDIVVNTAEHVRSGGVVDRHGLTVAREEMDIRYLGLMRLAQAFGPVLRFARRRRRQFGRGLRQSAVRARADELAGLRQLFGDRGRVPVGGAMHARGAAARRRQGAERVLRPARDRMVPDRAAAEGDAGGARQRGGPRAASRASRTCSSATSPRTSAQRLAVNPKALEREMAG